MPSIPMAKVLTEVFKVATKPLVKVITRNVVKSPFWRDSVFLQMGRNYNKMSLRLRLYAQGLKRNKEQVEKSARMSDEAALDLGAELVANGATLLFGLMAIALQQTLSSQADQRKADEKKRQEMEQAEMIRELNEKVLEIGLAVEYLDTQMRSMNRLVLSMQSYNDASRRRQVPKKDDDTS